MAPLPGVTGRHPSTCLSCTKDALIMSSKPICDRKIRKMEYIVEGQERKLSQGLHALWGEVELETLRWQENRQIGEACEITGGHGDVQDWAAARAMSRYVALLQLVSGLMSMVHVATKGHSDICALAC